MLTINEEDRFSPDSLFLSLSLSLVLSFFLVCSLIQLIDDVILAAGYAREEALTKQ